MLRDIIFKVDKVKFVIMTTFRYQIVSRFGKYKPYNKPGNIPLYINGKPNHSPNIIKNLPENISRRINKLSSNKFISMQSSLVYICKADTPNIIENHPHYIGLTENTFKDRFYKHKNSFKYESKRNATELSNFVWENKHTNTETNLVWNILDKARVYRPETKRCLLCLTEKYHIIFSKLNLLNSRNELVTKCRHENKFYLVNFKDNIT